MKGTTMKVRKSIYSLMVASSMGGMLFQDGCAALTGTLISALDECAGSGTISEDQFDDLGFFDQLGYQENDCGRFAPRDDLFGDLF